MKALNVHEYVAVMTIPGIQHFELRSFDPTIDHLIVTNILLKHNNPSVL